MDFKDIKELIRVFDKSELNKLRIKEADFEISMQRGFESGITNVSTTPYVQATPVAVSSSSQLASQASITNNVINEENKPNSSKDGLTINAPMVGTYYSAPSPESPEFVKVGDIVKKGQTVCILEAMKIMNEVEAEFDCKIVEILIQNGSPVEFDMPIFVIERI